MSDRSDKIAEAARCIREGGVVAYPAEACFGLGCHPDRTDALSRIRQMKSRKASQGFILVSDQLDRVLPWLDWEALTEAQRQRVTDSWPGPISWLIPASERSGAALRGEFETIAVRISAFSTLRDLCAASEVPLVSTSANRGGQLPLTDAQQVAEVFSDDIDYLLDLPIEGLDKPSRIMDAVTLQTIRSA